MNNLFAFGLTLALFALTACEDENSVQNATAIKTKVALKVQVGEMFYDDLNSTIIVEGFNSLNEATRIGEYNYHGNQDNIIDIPPTYERYRFRVSQWGKTFEHLLTRSELMSHRINGPSTSTIVLGGFITPTKLKGFTRFMDRQVEGVIQRIPVSQEHYEYQGGKLSKISAYEYNQETQTFDLKRYFFAHYDANRLSKLKGYLADTDEQFNENVYTYLADGRLSKIEEINLPENLSNRATFSYHDETNDEVTVTYQTFNGNSFSYSFSYEADNIVAEEIRRGGEVCSNGTRTYDKQINPFKHTGYIDFMLSNFSINNQVGEDIQYKACAFPEMTIVSQSYVYLDNGYPFSKETTYSNGLKGEERYLYYQD